MASPATVSRAGMIFFDVADIGYAPFVDSWLAKKIKSEEEGAPGFVALLQKLFEKYVEVLLLAKRTSFLRVFPLCALVPRAQGSSGAVATVQFVWRGHAKTSTTRAGPWPDFAAAGITQARYLRLLHLRVRTLPLADKVAYAKSSACSAEALQRYVEQTLPHKRRAGAGAKRVWLECLVHGNLDPARPSPTRVPLSTLLYGEKGY